MDKSETSGGRISISAAAILKQIHPARLLAWGVIINQLELYTT